MKIIILNHNQEYFGTYFRCQMFGQALAETYGHEVIMLCASGKNFDPIIRKQKISERFTIITLPRIKYGQYFSGQLLRLIITLFYLLGKRKYDLVYAFTVAQPQIAIPAVIAKIIRRKRLMIDWDDLWGGGFANLHGGLVARVLTFFEIKTLQFADHITYVSQLLGDKLTKLTHIQSSKVPNACNYEQTRSIPKALARQKVRLPDDLPIVISVGNTYTESFNNMIKAFASAKTIKPELQLVLIGELNLSKEQEDLLNEHRSNIIIIGRVPYQEIGTYLSSADALLLPMDNNPIEEARFPMRFGDYLCIGRPIISNAVGEVKYYLEKYNCGYVSSPNDFTAMAKHIIAACENSTYNQEISEQARSVASGVLNRNHIVEKLAEIIKNIEFIRT